jgi:plasmid stabilization system protein ParE
MPGKRKVRFTANFERNLSDLGDFLHEAQAPQAVESLINDLLETVIPNLERFPSLGRNFRDRAGLSVEVIARKAALASLLATLGQDSELREYVMKDHLLLYAVNTDTIFLLSIRHHKQLSFDFTSLWTRL